MTEFDLVASHARAAAKSGDPGIHLELVQHARDGGDGLVVGRSLGFGRGSRRENGCARQPVRASRGARPRRGGARIARELPRRSALGGAPETGKRCRTVVADAGGAIHFPREALDRVFGAREFLEQFDIEVVVVAVVDHLGRLIGTHHRAVKSRLGILRLAAAPPRHRGRVVHLEAEVAERAELLLTGAMSAESDGDLLAWFGNLGAEQVRVELAEAPSDLVRRGLRDDEQRQRQEEPDHDNSQPRRVDLQERLADDPAHDPATVGESDRTVRRLRMPAEHVAQAGDRGQQQAESDPDPGVVVHARRMPEEPNREHHHDHRKCERHAAEKAAEGVRVERDRNVTGGVEPLNSGTDDRQDHEEERDTVAPLLLGQGLVTEQPHRATDNVGESQPRTAQQPRLVVRLDGA